MKDDLPGVSQTEFEAMLRRYVAKIGARYAPVLAVLLVIVLILILVPTTQPTSNGFGAAVGAGYGSTAGGYAAGAGAGARAGGPGGLGADGVSSAGGGGADGAPSGTVTSGTASGLGAPGNAGDAANGADGGNGLASGGGASGAFGSATAAGVSKTGVTCGGGARQFGWSIHAPYCQPAFSGDNGGATAQGVTGSTITLTYRIPDSAEDSAIAALSGTANVSEPAMITDMQTYINFFNKEFELYGRHVILKAFKGQGDYIEEDQGQDLGAAQADAVSAKDMGGFGDVTFALGASQPYEQDLATEHVMSFSAAAQPQSWFEQYAPYEYSVQGPSGTVSVSDSAAVVCRRMAGMDAIFSSDTLYQHTKRVFGIIYPENPSYSQEVQQYESQIMAGCGLKPAKVIAYAINVAQYGNEATSAVALMEAAHVTTILCACDPIFPILLTPAASAQSYYPEWFAADFGDPVSQDYTQSEWGNSIAGGLPSEESATSEAYKAYELANPGHQPAEEPPTSPPYFYVPYYTLLQVFEALQAAGPDLTPYTFEQGMFSLPPSLPNGDMSAGHWVFGTDVFDPVVSFGLVWWNQNATSTFDNKKGTYQACNGGQIYLVTDLAALGGPGQQLDCFGK